MYQSMDAVEQSITRDYPVAPSSTFQPDQSPEWGTLPGFLASIRVARLIAQGRIAALLLPDRDGVGLRLVAGIGLSRELLKLVPTSGNTPFAANLAQRGQGLLANGERDLRDFGYPELPRYRGMPFVSVPVPQRGEVNGLLTVAAPIGRATFQAADLHGLQLLASLIGATLPSLATSERLERQEATIAELQQQLIQVQETERQRLARELHDEAGHALTIALLRVDLERVRPTTSPATRDALTQARDAIMAAATSLNDMAFRLRPRILEDLGLLPALRTLVAQTQVPGTLEITLEADGALPELSSATELAVFRVVQEALTNVRKHASASAASIRLTVLAHALLLVVRDDGAGIDRAEGHDALIAGRAGQGLRGMRERVEAIGGSCAIGMRHEGGTQVVVTLPLHRQGGADGQS